MEKVNLAVFISGNGTNFEHLVKASLKNEMPNCHIEIVISNRKNAYGLIRAKKYNIEAIYLKNEEEIISILKKHNVRLIVLAGYLAILSKEFINSFKNECGGTIINIHPSLIPSFCGKGYYGLKVHEAALNYGVKVTGASVHYVNEIPDGGKIIIQKAVYIKENDSPITLQKRVMRLAEWKILSKACQMVSEKILKGENL